MPGRHSIKGPRRARRWLGWAVALLAVLALTGFLLVGADGPADPVLGGIPGYGETAFRVTPAGAASPAGRYCALLADTEAQRARGMMGRRDLAGFDGMLFRFDADTTSAFYMRNVPVPLSIAWFDAEGRFVSATDMAPCPDQEGCPTYPPPAPYRVALEVLQGGLGRLGIGPGSTMSVGGPCTE
ncbi:MAG TPA: DUF192 domain-containing protein [Acidimicrobiales bacterium]|jgi:uncharacterized membrane protein (UPF0127 family)|nr:DUF192 domain-containing protein [Acidimicrobiales bacterium]